MAVAGRVLLTKIGAKVYYMRQCFHNWQDENCRTILERIGKAMDGEARFLIHEIVMPEVGASEWESMMDVLMMAGYSTWERSERQWRELVGSVDGLKVVKIWSGELSAESIIEIVKV